MTRGMPMSGLRCAGVVGLAAGFSTVVLPTSADAGLLSWLSEGLGGHKPRRRAAKNKRLGTRRESREARALSWVHPFCSVQREVTLRTRGGAAARDPLTGTARRFDLAVIGATGRLVELVEVTSMTADKRGQQDKTRRIRRRYRKLHVRDKRDGRLIPVRRGLLFPTRFRTVRRR